MSDGTDTGGFEVDHSITKRDLMKVAGALGIGVGGAATGTAAADGDRGKGHGHGDDDGGDRFNGNPTFGSVSAHLFDQVNLYNAPRDGISDRPIATTEPIQLWVDPDGDDDAPGSREKPVASLQEALNRIPYIIAHPTDIVLTSGTAEDPKVHDVGEGVFDAPHFAGPASNRQETQDVFEYGTAMNYAIHSESGNAEDTVLRSNYYCTFQTLGNSGLNCGFKDLTLETSVQCYGGVIGIVDCISKGARERPNICGGYASHIQFVRGEINAPVITRAGQGATIGLNATPVVPEGDSYEYDDPGVVQQYHSGCTVYVRGDAPIEMPWFAEERGGGPLAFVITEDNLYHPAAPDGLI